MTQLLDNAFKKVSELPEAEQDTFARFILDEIESEQKWESSFLKSEDMLASMSDEALNDFQNKKSEKLDIDKL